MGESKSNINLAMKNLDHVADSCTPKVHYTLLLEVPARGPMGNMTSTNHNKMAAPLEEFTREEKRAVICFFLGSEGEKPAEIYQRMKRQHGDTCLSLWQVYECTESLKVECQLRLIQLAPVGLTLRLCQTLSPQLNDKKTDD
jgi:hypothetical protein